MLEDPEQIIRAKIEGNAKLLWFGRPQLGLMLRPIDALLIPFSLLWGGFAVFWEVSVIRDGAPVFFAVWGVPFVLIGLYLIVGRFFYDAAQRRKQFYGVTSERVILKSGVFNSQVKSLPLDSLIDISLSERADGGGTITFGQTSWMSFWSYPGAGWPSWASVLPQFELEGRARDVYQTILQAKRARKES